MARKPDIQYVGQFYVHGSEARAPEIKPIPKPVKRPVAQPRPEKKMELLVDPVALASIAVAAVMLVLMVVSTMHYVQALTDYQNMEQYVISLQDENARLSHELQINDAYDLDSIRTTALTMGMIPAGEAETAQITLNIPQPEPEPTFWDNLTWFFQGLFA